MTPPIRAAIGIDGEATDGPSTDVGVIEAAERIRAGDWTSAGLTAACLDRIDALEPSIQAWVHVDARGALAEARERDAAMRRRASGRAAPRRADRDQGHHRRRGHAHPGGRGRVRAHDADRRRAAGGAAARRRGGDPRQDPRDPVRLPGPGADAQPVVARAHTGRLVVRVGGGRRVPDGPRGDRHPDRRLDPAARGLLRGRGLQGGVRRGPARWRRAALEGAGPCRADRPVRGGRRPARGRADGPSDRDRTARRAADRRRPRPGRAGGAGAAAPSRCAGGQARRRGGARRGP